MKLKIFSVILLCAFYACKSKIMQPKIIPLTHFTEVTSLTNGNQDTLGKKKVESFIISNAPDNERLKALIIKYNDSTLKKQDFKQYFILERVFYKAGDGFKEGFDEKSSGYFDHNYLSDHAADIILKVQWTDFGRNMLFSGPIDKSLIP